MSACHCQAKHEKAVTYFQRALKLNKRFLAAWTLMGHEFVEMKNTGAAIEAYRRGVDVNPRDYRAWYGLGQTYELLNMFFYALYYYRKVSSSTNGAPQPTYLRAAAHLPCILPPHTLQAVKLRPTDARMWCALASCYQRLERPDDAIRAFERAAANQDQEGIATLELARLYADKVRALLHRTCHGTGPTAAAAALTPLSCQATPFGRAAAADKFREHLALHASGPETLATNGSVSDGVAEALRFLGEYALGQATLSAMPGQQPEDVLGQLAAAAKYCGRLLECGKGAEEEWAKQALRQIRLREAQHHRDHPAA